MKSTVIFRFLLLRSIYFNLKNIIFSCIKPRGERKSQEKQIPRFVRWAIARVIAFLIIPGDGGEEEVE